ncbi:TRAP transporter fused permease subunit [Paralimibaculum aggregatum]|uniref:TRAP transporter fused permease subunit n=1 Tax=Paralimibaculum aggregatum TaxID=3036245 RepID=A0ABQ6LRT7_9RHOB|nr:TRAP transporter fused permease subunit [Limibaculum sp. NKW23]GMG84126.1 TRAP transporter fused permease subunit [Limibaculum sp. NKW23]
MQRGADSDPGTRDRSAPQDDVAGADAPAADGTTPDGTIPEVGPVAAGGFSLGRLLFSTGARRQLGGRLGLAVKTYAAGVAVWTLYSATLARIDLLALTVVFLCLMLVPSFLVIGATERADPKRATILDFALAAGSLACTVYFILTVDDIATRISLLTPLSEVQFFFAALVTLLTIEITRRSVGLLLCLIVLVFIAYNLFGDTIEGPMGHGVITLNHFLDINVYTTDGLFGVPVEVCATYAFLFVMFGTFLERARGGDFFFDIAAAISGRSPGGPAKVAVVSSALFGTMSGSPTADVATTGSITIPMMRRLGYRPAFAGGVEVAASTGGSLLPPVMGSAAFIMAEITGIDYLDIAAAAIVPALLFYAGIFVQVHCRALRDGLQPLPSDRLSSLAGTLAWGWPFVIPIAVLVGVLVEGYSPTMAAACATLALIVSSQIRRDTRLTPAAIFDALANTTYRMIGVTGACAAAGLVIGGITMTGLAAKFSYIAFSFAGDSMMLALLLSAGVTIILGLGMPTPSAYVLSAVLIGPTLVNDFGIPALNAHLFLMYFAVLSAMTPPVAVAAYSAAAIAQANPLLIAVTAVKLSVVAFVVPIAFTLSPDVLAPGWSPGAWVGVVSMLLGTAAVAVAAEGWIRGVMPGWMRLVLAAAGLLLLAPGFLLPGIGLAAAGAVVALRRSAAVAAPPAA